MIGIVFAILAAIVALVIIAVMYVRRRNSATTPSTQIIGGAFEIQRESITLKEPIGIFRACIVYKAELAVRIIYSFI